MERQRCRQRHARYLRRTRYISTTKIMGSQRNCVNLSWCQRAERCFEIIAHCDHTGTTDGRAAEHYSVFMDIQVGVARPGQRQGLQAWRHCDWCRPVRVPGEWRNSYRLAGVAARRWAFAVVHADPNVVDTTWQPCHAG